MEYQYPFNYYTGQGFRACLDEAVRAGNPIGGTRSDCNSNKVANDSNNSSSSNSSSNSNVSNSNVSGNPSWLSLQKVSVSNQTTDTATVATQVLAGAPGTNTVSHEDSRSAPVVDYATFKQTLRRYSRCRTKLRRLFETQQQQQQQKSKDLFLVKDTEPILAEVEGGIATATATATTSTKQPQQPNDPWAQGLSYAPMSDNGETETVADCSCDLPGILRTEPRTRTVHRRTILRRVSTLERDSLTRFLAEETQKISVYYESKLASLNHRVHNWTTTSSSCGSWKRTNRNNPSVTNIHTTDDEHQNQHQNRNDGCYEDELYLRKTVGLGHELLECLAFCAINAVVVRQILSRYDAFARSVGGIPLMEFYWKQVLRSTNSPKPNQTRDKKNYNSNSNNCYELRRILLQQDVTDLCDVFERHCGIAKKVYRQYHQTHDETPDTDGDGDGDFEQTLSDIAERFRTDREELCRVMQSAAIDTISSGTPSSVHISSAKTNNTNEKDKDTSSGVLRALRNSMWLGLFLEDQIGWYLYGTDRDRSKSLTDEIRSIAKWRRRLQFIWSSTSSPVHFSVRVNAATYYENENDRTVPGCGGGLACLDLECHNLAGCGTQDVNVSENDEDDDKLAFDATTSTARVTTRTTSTIPTTTHQNNHPPRAANIGTSVPGSFRDESSSNDGVTKQQTFNLFLALAGGFLYCMNYYIVEPSSTMYANALGAQDAAGAILIGMMPIACCLAAIVYSVWTNTVYRQPFLISCCLMVTGNVVYSSAFHYKSLPMALTGRFLTGLGGPKMIVRRYIADTTASNIRTSVNALFGMVVAAGSALGPCCAIVLAKYDFILVLPGGSELWFNSMTGPGWFMAVLWSIFYVALFVGFREQERIGLYEKLHQEREAMSCSRNQAPRVLGSATATTTNGDYVYQDTSTNRPSLPLNFTLSVGDESIPTMMSTKSSMSMMWKGNYGTESNVSSNNSGLWNEWQNASRHFLFPVRICMGLLFAKVFVIETLVSCTSALSKNRYGWTIHEVGALGCFNGFFVIPISILVGKLSLSYQDRYLMVCLLLVGVSGLSLLIDFSDLFSFDGEFSERTYNKNLWWSVGPTQYVIGYFVTYVSVQSFEGIIGSALSKLIPTALATGTFNSGLLATLVDTSGRSCGDLFIALMGFWNIRQLMNLLFVPGVVVLLTCLVIVRRYYDLLAV